MRCCTDQISRSQVQCFVYTLNTAIVRWQTIADLWIVIVVLLNFMTCVNTHVFGFLKLQYLKGTAGIYVHVNC